MRFTRWNGTPASLATSFSIERFPAQRLSLSLTSADVRSPLGTDSFHQPQLRIAAASRLHHTQACLMAVPLSPRPANKNRNTTVCVSKNGFGMDGSWFGLDWCPDSQAVLRRTSAVHVGRTGTPRPRRSVSPHRTGAEGHFVTGPSDRLPPLAGKAPLGPLM